MKFIFKFASDCCKSEIGGAVMPALCEDLVDKAEHSVFQERLEVL